MSRVPRILHLHSTFDAGGKEIPGLRVIGYQAPESFLKSLERLP